MLPARRDPDGRSTPRPRGLVARVITAMNPRTQKAESDAFNALTDEDVRNSLKMQGSRNIQPDDIICKDHPIKNFVLSNRTDQWDVLYIRGHCEKGTDVVQSSNHASTTRAVMVGKVRY